MLDSAVPRRRTSWLRERRVRVQAGTRLKSKSSGRGARIRSPRRATARRTSGRDYIIPGVDADDPEPYKGTPARSATTAARTRSRSSTWSSSSAAPDPERLQPRPAGQHDLDGARPVGHGQERPDQAHRRPARPDSGDVLVHGESIPNMTDDEPRGPQEVRSPLPGRRPVRVDERLRQHLLPAPAAHRQSEEEIEEIVSRRLREVGLAEAMYKMPNEPSGGMRGPASPGRSSSTRRSSCSTSPTRASTRFARRCSAS